MVGAGLLVRSLQNLENFYPGFPTDNVLLFDVNPRMLGYTVAADERFVSQADRSDRRYPRNTQNELLDGSAAFG